MKVLKWNGEYWYVDARPVWERILSWVVWVGGWKVWREMRRFRPEKLHLDTLAPISVLGHRLTWYGWGFDVKTPEGVLVVVMKKVGWGIERAYVSRDGTPGGAHVWIVGAPPEVLHAAVRRKAAQPVGPS